MTLAKNLVSSTFSYSIYKIAVNKQEEAGKQFYISENSYLGNMSMI